MEVCIVLLGSTYHIQHSFRVRVSVSKYCTKNVWFDSGDIKCANLQLMDLTKMSVSCLFVCLDA